MRAHAVYANGASLNYTLCVYSPLGGPGNQVPRHKGELSHPHVEVHGVFSGRQDKSHGSGSMTTTLHLAGEAPRKLEVWAGEGDHGGADPVMLADLFDPSTAADRYGRGSSHIDGAWSILTAIAANASIERGEVVHIDRFLTDRGIHLPQKKC